MILEDEDTHLEMIVHVHKSDWDTVAHDLHDLATVRTF